MEAVAAGASASIVGIVIFSILLGAINGSIFWVRRNGLLIGTVVSIVMLLLLTAFVVGFSSAGVILWSLPSLLLAFLASYTVAIKAKVSMKLNAIWCSVIAFFITLIASVPYMLIFRVSIFAPIAFAIVANIIIFNAAMKARKWLQQ